jgi:hypothetical protein
MIENIFLGIWKSSELNNVFRFCNTNAININHLYVSIGILIIKDAADQCEDEMEHLTIQLTIIVQNMMKQKENVPTAMSECFFHHKTTINWAKSVH